MGLNLFRSSSGGTQYPVAPEPKPDDFRIVSAVEVNGWSVVMADYPGCTTFQGRKLMVYACLPDQVRAQARLDPHFSDRAGELFPIARFEPTPAGICLAYLVCENRGGA